MASELYERIKEVVGEERVSESDFERLFYSSDVSPISPELIEKLGTIPDIIARPKNVEEVSLIVKIAAQKKIPIVPRGGASWWLGGSIPYKGGIVLDLTSLNSTIEIDNENLTVTADCGVTWEELEDVLRMKSFFLGTRPGSAASATVGGWISTGGVGIGSYKYGSVGDLVRSLEVVLPNGEIINTGSKKLAVQGSGYNLNWLFVGAEGTLGVITKAALKILPKPKEGPHHISYSFSDIKSCILAIKKVVSSRLLPHHIAFGDRRHFELLKSMGKNVPEGEIVLCITLEGEKEIIDYGLKKVDEMLKSAGGGLKTCDARHPEECNECTIEFRGREVAIYPVPGEIFVGILGFERVIPKIYELFDNMNLKGGLIGSMVDRRTVMIMPYYLHGEEGEKTFLDFQMKLERIACEEGGRRVGLGLFFANSLANIKDAKSIALMQALKESIDPDNIMNPGKTIGGEEFLLSYLGSEG
jgi:glycolate oxidase